MAARKSSSKKQATKPRHLTKAMNRDMEEEGDLSPAQLRELEKRIQDLNDRTRFLLASSLGPNFVLYYNVSEDTYGWNDPTHATLFKRQKTAQAVQRLLGDKDTIVECAVDRKGRLVKKSVGKPTGSADRSSPRLISKKKPSKKKPSKKKPK